MPRFPVTFGRRKSTADNLENVSIETSSFRVMDRSEVAGGAKNYDSNRLPVKSQTMPNTYLSDTASVDDNIFVHLNTNRGSTSSNTTKTASTDNSSRHSNASTAPSSADAGAQHQFQHQLHHHHQDDIRFGKKGGYGDIPLPPIPKSSTTGSSFLKSAGRTFSFGGQKKHLPLSPAFDDQPPETPPKRSTEPLNPSETPVRDRAMTASTASTATPPKLEEEFTLDLGGDFGSMLDNFDKRTSVATLRNDATNQPILSPRNLTGNRIVQQPAPLQVDQMAVVEPSPYSWGSQNSSDRLMYSNSLAVSPTNENAPPVPRHASPADNGPASSSTTFGPDLISSSQPLASSAESGLKRSSAVLARRRSATVDYAANEESEDSILKDSLSAVNRFLAGGSVSTNVKSSPVSRFRRNENSPGSGYEQLANESTSPLFDAKPSEDDNIFDTTHSLARSNRSAQPFIARKPSPPRNKVMTPAQFERYRRDKEQEGFSKAADVSKPEETDGDEEDSYDDDMDEIEKSKLAAKQRRKQEAHMTVYRQQMMKVTGEAASGVASRGSMQMFMSTPNLGSLGAGGPGGVGPHGASDASDDDEEVPLAILAAHGFPNKNRPPTRLSTMMSNPNLRAAAAPSYQRPSSAMGDGSGGGGAPASGSGGRLPVFARNLPQDPYGLVNPAVREAFQLGGGAAASPMQPGGPLPPGGLVGVIASEERSRAMRRGSPAHDTINKPLPASMSMGQFDPMTGIPAHTMYPGMAPPQQPILTPGDQAQIQMSQQMQQFMQMQMQFMQMMAANNGGNGMQRPASHYSGMGGMIGGMPMGMPMGMGMGAGNSDTMRHSFVETSSPMEVAPPGRPEGHVRTMSMVQPSSASWIQPAMSPGYAPSIRIQGANGYAPSIAPSERSNVGLPGRYRPVSHVPAGPVTGDYRKSMAMSGAVGSPIAEAGSNETTPNADRINHSRQASKSPTAWDNTRKLTNHSPLNQANTADDDDDEEGWAAMKAKREKKRSLWKSKKPFAAEIGALIS